MGVMYLSQVLRLAQEMKVSLEDLKALFKGRVVIVDFNAAFYLTDPDRVGFFFAWLVNVAGALLVLVALDSPLASEKGGNREVVGRATESTRLEALLVKKVADAARGGDAVVAQVLAEKLKRCMELRFLASDVRADRAFAAAYSRLAVEQRVRLIKRRSAGEADKLVNFFARTLSADGVESCVVSRDGDICRDSNYPVAQLERVYIVPSLVLGRDGAPVAARVYTLAAARRTWVDDTPGLPPAWREALLSVRGLWAAALSLLKGDMNAGLPRFSFALALVVAFRAARIVREREPGRDPAEVPLPEVFEAVAAAVVAIGYQLPRADRAAGAGEFYSAEEMRTHVLQVLVQVHNNSAAGFVIFDEPWKALGGAQPRVLRLGYPDSAGCPRLAFGAAPTSGGRAQLTCCRATAADADVEMQAFSGLFSTPEHLEGFASGELRPLNGPPFADEEIAAAFAGRLAWYTPEPPATRKNASLARCLERARVRGSVFERTLTAGEATNFQLTPLARESGMIELLLLETPALTFTALCGQVAAAAKAEDEGEGGGYETFRSRLRAKNLAKPKNLAKHLLGEGGAAAAARLAASNVHVAYWVPAFMMIDGVVDPSAVVVLRLGLKPGAGHTGIFMLTNAGGWMRVVGAKKGDTVELVYMARETLLAHAGDAGRALRRFSEVVPAPTPGAAVGSAGGSGVRAAAGAEAVKRPRRRQAERGAPEIPTLGDRASVEAALAAFGGDGEGTGCRLGAFVLALRPGGEEGGARAPPPPSDPLPLVEFGADGAASAAAVLAFDDDDDDAGAAGAARRSSAASVRAAFSIFGHIGSKLAEGCRVAALTRDPGGSDHATDLLSSAFHLTLREGAELLAVHGARDLLALANIADHLAFVRFTAARSTLSAAKHAVQRHLQGNVVSKFVGMSERYVRVVCSDGTMKFKVNPSKMSAADVLRRAGAELDPPAPMAVPDAIWRALLGRRRRRAAAAGEPPPPPPSWEHPAAFAADDVEAVVAEHGAELQKLAREYLRYPSAVALEALVGGGA